MMFKLFKSKLSQPEQGLTLVEVLVAILIVTTFTLVAMQALAIAAVFKARAKQFAEATTWIQDDLDNVKNQASLVPYTSTELTAAATAGQNTIVVSSVSDLRVGDALRVGTDITNNVIQSINTGTSTITLTANLGTVQPSATTVIARCNASSTTEGFGQYLLNTLPAITANNPNTKTTTNLATILGKTFTITRTPTVRNAFPYEVLELTYSLAPQNAHTTLTAIASATSTTLSVASTSGFKAGDKLMVGGTDADNVIQIISGNTITLTNQLGSEQSLGAVVDAVGKSVAIVNTEVIPDAAFQCPQ